jgi:hypothetical protein
VPPRKARSWQALKQEARLTEVRRRVKTLPSGGTWILLLELEAGWLIEMMTGSASVNLSR